MILHKNSLLVALLPCVLSAQNSIPLLVDVDWLSAHISDRNVVVLAVQPKADYTAGHIPGARYIAMEDVSRPMDHSSSKELMLELPAPEELRGKLAALGVSDDSHIVVSYGTGLSFTSATRVVLALDFIGLGNQTSLLNGGVAAWSKASKALTSVVPEIKTGKLTPRPAKAVVVDAALVKSIDQHPSYKLVDGRSPAAFNGTESMMGISGGHIHGAVNIPFNQIVGDTLTIDRQHVADLFRDAGIKPGDTVVAYCYVGQVATAVVFGARLLGNPVMLYDGSLQDWTTNHRGALEK